ncbi:hypothetical protein, partial [Serratia marcescens]|uniref:hypothetical protein n=1 Tax=Serratia marcescens TaxID=615 RepID=UPI001ADE6DE5
TLATPRNSKKFSNAFNCLFCGRTVHNANGKASGMLILYASARGFTGKSDLFSRHESLTHLSPAFHLLMMMGYHAKHHHGRHRAISAALNGQRNCKAGD